MLAALAGELMAMAAAAPPTIPKKLRRSDVNALPWLVTRALVPVARRAMVQKRFIMALLLELSFGQSR